MCLDHLKRKEWFQEFGLNFIQSKVEDATTAAGCELIFLFSDFSKKKWWFDSLLKVLKLSYKTKLLSFKLLWSFLISEFT